MSRLLYASLFAIVLLGSALLVPSSAYAMTDSRLKERVDARGAVLDASAAAQDAKLQEKLANSNQSDQDKQAKIDALNAKQDAHKQAELAAFTAKLKQIQTDHEKNKKDPDKDKDNDKRACVHKVTWSNGKYKRNCDSDQDHKPLKRPIQ